MTFHFSPHSPSAHPLFWTRVAIVVAVLLTALVSATVLQLQIERYEIQPEQLPIADVNIWHALSQ